MDSFDESLLTSYLDDELSASERRFVEEQLAANPQLVELLDELRQLRSLVGQLSNDHVSFDLTNGVFERAKQIAAEQIAPSERSVHDKLDGQTPNKLVERAAPWWQGTSIRWIAAFATAACLLVMFANPFSTPKTQLTRGEPNSKIEDSVVAAPMVASPMSSEAPSGELAFGAGAPRMAEDASASLAMPLSDAPADGAGGVPEFGNMAASDDVGNLPAGPGGSVVGGGLGGVGGMGSAGGRGGAEVSDSRFDEQRDKVAANAAPKPSASRSRLPGMETPSTGRALPPAAKASKLDNGLAELGAPAMDGNLAYQDPAPAADALPQEASPAAETFGAPAMAAAEPAAPSEPLALAEAGDAKNDLALSARGMDPQAKELAITETTGVEAGLAMPASPQFDAAVQQNQLERYFLYIAPQNTDPNAAAESSSQALPASPTVLWYFDGDNHLQVEQPIPEELITSLGFVPATTSVPEQELLQRKAVEGLPSKTSEVVDDSKAKENVNRFYFGERLKDGGQGKAEQSNGRVPTYLVVPKSHWFEVRDELTSRGLTVVPMAPSGTEFAKQKADSSADRPAARSLRRPPAVENPAPPSDWYFIQVQTLVP
jgi:anti-sigma factor RsiW